MDVKKKKIIRWNVKRDQIKLKAPPTPLRTDGEHKIRVITKNNFCKRKKTDRYIRNLKFLLCLSGIVDLVGPLSEIALCLCLE